MAKGPTITKMTDEHMLIHPEMVDEDNVKGFEGRFRENSCIYDGCSGQKRIDTLFENTSVDRVENPREKTTKAPIDLTTGLYLHRRM